MQKELVSRLGESIIEVGDAKTLTEMQHVTLSDGEVIATSPYVMEKAKDMLQEMEEKPFGHFVIRGPSGSGKMTQIRLAHHLNQSN